MGGHGRAGGHDTEPVPCVELFYKDVGWATVVAAGVISAEPVPTSVGTAKTDAKALSAAGKTRPRPGQRSTVATEAETRPTKLPEGAERSSILIRGPCVRKITKIYGGEREPTQDSTCSAGDQPTKPTPGICEERVLSPQALIR